MEGTQQKQKCIFSVIKEEKQRQDGKLYCCAGIKMWYYEGEAKTKVTHYIKDISTDIVAVSMLVDHMNQHGLDPIHFYDVVEDFCQNENRIL